MPFINKFGGAAPSRGGTDTDRLIFLGGTNPSDQGRNVLEYITISSTGNTTDFGDSPFGVINDSNGVCSASRGVYSGLPWGNGEIIEYITMATTGNATDFGDLTEAVNSSDAFSSDTRGIWAGGNRGANANQITIDYITIATTGNAIDFGDLSTSRRSMYGGMSSTTRGVSAGGRSSSQVKTDEIAYVTIASTGNTTDFGNLSAVRSDLGGCGDSTRGMVHGGYAPQSGQSPQNIIEYITIASTGNMTDFGDITAARSLNGGGSNATRSIVNQGGRFNGLASTANNIEYVTTASTGNASDFGDLSEARGQSGSMSYHLGT